MSKRLQHLLATGQCQIRHGYVIRPEEGADDYVAVTITSRADAQCTVYRSKNRQDAYFHHYMPLFVAGKVASTFPNHVIQRATHYELFLLENEDNDDHEVHF